MTYGICQLKLNALFVRDPVCYLIMFTVVAVNYRGTPNPNAQAKWRKGQPDAHNPPGPLTR